MRSASNGLLYLVGATYVSPAIRIWMHGILPCSTIRKSSQYTEQRNRIGPSAMRLDATISLQFDIALFQRFRAFRFLQLFDFFDFFDFPTFYPAMDLTLPSYHLIFIDHRSSLAMPYPKHQSHYSQVFYVVAVAYIAVAKSWLSEKKSWRSAAPQHHNTYYCQPPPTPPTSCSCQRSMVYGI